MSASEQEVRSQIAEMREALQSARASARTGKIIGVLGVLVGLAIVAIYVVLFIGLGKSVVKSDELPRVLRARVERLQLDRAVSQIIEEAAPAYLAEARTLVEDLELPKLASEELQLMMKDLEPVLRQELERVRPQLQIVLENQREQTLNAVEGMLQQKLNARLQTIISRQGQRISEEQGLDEATLQMVATNLVDASGEAFRGMIEKRKGNLQEELAEMQKLLDQVLHRYDAHRLFSTATTGFHHQNDSLILALYNIYCLNNCGCGVKSSNGPYKIPQVVKLLR